MKVVHLQFYRYAFSKLKDYFLSFLKKLLFIYPSAVNPARAVFFGYLSYVVVGWILLSLPCAQIVPVKAIDNLFIATSAMSTTGLSTISVSDNYNLLGQIIVLILIQLGGIGYMTLGSFIMLSRKTELPTTRTIVTKAVFSLPESFEINKFIKSVIVFTLAIEAVGALLLYWIFWDAGEENAIWSAIFHSVSAFCTAGFSLYNNSFENFKDNFWLHCVIGTLSYLGAIGFIVLVDYWRKFKGETHRVTLTSKIIIWATFWMTVCGTFLIFFDEPEIQTMPADTRFMAAFFQAMTAMTTVGFNTINLAGLSKASVLVIIVLMVIGASPSGTGGGVKSTTFTAVVGVVWSAIKGETKVTFLGKTIPFERIWMAVASSAFYLSLLVFGVYLLDLTESASFDKIVFEAASAIGTVGLSMGITSDLTNMGKLVIVFLMFSGRVGPLTFGSALFSGKDGEKEPKDNDLAV